MEYYLKPWEHQLKGIANAIAQRDYALFFDMGCGKTATTINILRHRYAENKRLLRTLILCPVAVVENWQREFAIHSKVGDRATVLKGPQTKRRKKFAEIKDQRPAPIIITNFEALQMQDLLNDFLQWGVEIFVIDESHNFKNHKAKRTKAAILVADQTTHNYILTGTPILNCSRDIWAQFRILDRGDTFGSNYYGFEKKYFMDANSGMPRHIYFPKWVPREGIEEQFQQMIYSKAMRVMKHECLDLPPLTKMRVNVELSAEQRRLYEEMKRDFITYLESEACVATLAVTKALRLQQIVTGFVKTDLDEEINLNDNPRLDALQETLENIGPAHKVIIWAVFKQNFRQIGKLLDKMKIKHTTLHGGTTDRQKNIDEFQLDPSCRVIVANQQAGGVGVNLTAASYAIFYSKNFSLALDLQAEARNYRAGSEVHKNITRIDLIAPNTIDEIILEALENKLELSERILDLKEKL